MCNKILLFQRIIPNYRVSILNELSKKLNVIICSGYIKDKNFLKNVKLPYPHLQVKEFYLCKRKQTLVLLNIMKPLWSLKPNIVITEFSVSNLSNYFLLLLKSFFKFKLILWGHGYNRRTDFYPEKSIKDKIRVWWMNKADALILYNENCRNVVEKYIKNPKKVFIAPNTLNTRKLIEIRSKLEKLGKNNVKKQIGFGDKYNLMYIGRLLAEKEPEKLIECFKIVSEKINSIKLHIVGDGPLYNRLNYISKGLNVKFWRSITDDIKTGELLFASDLMIIPGYLGLSIVQSFCFDTPVISQKKGIDGPFHSPEIEYIVHGKTGFLVEYGSNDKMVETIINYLLYYNKSEMRRNIRDIIENICSSEKMINGFREAVNFCLKI